MFRPPNGKGGIEWHGMTGDRDIEKLSDSCEYPLLRRGRKWRVVWIHGLQVVEVGSDKLRRDLGQRKSKRMDVLKEAVKVAAVCRDGVLAVEVCEELLVCEPSIVTSLGNGGGQRSLVSPQTLFVNPQRLRFHALPRRNACGQANERW
jgi:hypothetical protein